MSTEDEALRAEAVGDRRRARMLALQALYELDATTHEAPTVLRRRLEEDAAPPPAAAYARTLVEGVMARRTEIDEQITAAAPAWPLDQMSRVDKSILRLGIFELLFLPEVPPKVAINEAVEVAKIFGHETSPKFVNGVLGSIERGRRKSA